MGSPAIKSLPSRRYLLVVAVLLVALYVLLPQFGDFRSSWHLLSHPVPYWTAAAFTFTALTYVAAAATYSFLAFRPLRYGQVVLVELAAMFINRLLPGGIGALGANYAYLRRARHNVAQAASVVAVNNLLGALGHGLLLVGTLTLFSHQAANGSGHNGVSLSLLFKSVGAAALLVLVLVIVFGRRKFASQIIGMRNQLLSYRQRPGHLAGALLSSMVLTLCNVLCLVCCTLAMGVHLPFAAVLLVFSLGIGTGTATPTPGGLGGFEAGLVAGLIAYHVVGPAALAVALLYRLVSYWLPLPLGALAFATCQKRQLFSS